MEQIGLAVTVRAAPDLALTGSLLCAEQSTAGLHAAGRLDCRFVPFSRAEQVGSIEPGQANAVS